jgi:hypothetical protein
VTTYTDDLRAPCQVRTRGLDRLAERTGLALAAWGRRHAARRADPALRIRQRAAAEAAARSSITHPLAR